MTKTSVLALLVLVGACGGGGSGSGGGIASATTDVTGRWIGPWQSHRGAGGTFELSLTQTAGDVGGSGTASGGPCFGDGSVSGHVSGSMLHGSLKEPAFVVRFHALVSADEESMTGTYVTTGGPCTGDTGTITLQRH